jgi:predicted MFS family arabinose efflux permease
LLATRFGLTAPLAGGFLALALASVVVVAPSGPLGFCIAAPAISLLGLFIVPYVMGLLSQIDATGKLAAVGSSAMTLGGSLGSLVGGAALTQFGDPGLLGASLVFFAIVLLLIVPVTLGIDRAVLRTA